MFKDKTVLITGAAVGIGKACALQFAKGGANVILVDYNDEALAKTEAEVKSITGNVLSLVCDVSDNDSVLKVVESSISRFGKIDILVNNAALWRHYTAFVDTDIDTWKKFIDVNIMGTVYFTKAVLGNMKQNHYGRIINVASVAGVYGNPTMAMYSATKGAVISLTKALAKEVAADNITVNAVSPGTVSPAEQDDIDYVEPNANSYSGRTGSTRENADLICFLASDSAAYISGQNVQIDGCRKKI
ncbi:MAG: SDR family oxidoreductase [Oscillospiraceae bacterium]|nr:SDR family oxidoreductase [Oscillospiraceae bacterium]